MFNIIWVILIIVVIWVIGWFISAVTAYGAGESAAPPIILPTKKGQAERIFFPFPLIFWRFNLSPNETIWIEILILSEYFSPIPDLSISGHLKFWPLIFGHTLPDQILSFILKSCAIYLKYWPFRVTWTSISIRIMTSLFITIR